MYIHPNHFVNRQEPVPLNSAGLKLPGIKDLLLMSPPPTPVQEKADLAVSPQYGSPSYRHHVEGYGADTQPATSNYRPTHDYCLTYGTGGYSSQTSIPGSNFPIHSDQRLPSISFLIRDALSHTQQSQNISPTQTPLSQYSRSHYSLPSPLDSPASSSSAGFFPCFPVPQQEPSSLPCNSAYDIYDKCDYHGPCCHKRPKIRVDKETAEVEKSPNELFPDQLECLGEKKLEMGVDNNRVCSSEQDEESSKKRKRNRSGKKQNNKPYTFEQEVFFIYHRVELGMKWKEVAARYMERFPAREPNDVRTDDGLTCAYYRTNGHLPVFSKDGLLVIDPGSKHRYRGVPYKAKEIKCRSALVSMLQRFPEELVDPRNDYILPEHRNEDVRRRAAALAEQRKQYFEWFEKQLNSKKGDI
ncbi:hypothetical protein B0T26DRAFT_230367 [Lasiosphaeria miniovina]|uniref:Uncharacterized protein n=1 Tax=Lasiosphaeria miniovina TaxID=1954250 RepID=A0AA40AVI2_9PEZI|nr:uncharacterized protein B0T26DRAFT_230367 [Lasiosphaeria miniovina]KAK0722731.1 hypothetical protein B0T26DRAFT_230367 [Lasiosphaeria miniovina]